MKKEKIITYLIKSLVQLISPELIKTVFKEALYTLEEKIEETENEYDDKLILPILQMLHEVIK